MMLVQGLIEFVMEISHEHSDVSPTRNWFPAPMNNARMAAAVNIRLVMVKSRGCQLSEMSSRFTRMKGTNERLIKHKLHKILIY